MITTRKLAIAVFLIAVLGIWTTADANSLTKSDQKLDNPEIIIRLLVEANEKKDLPTMEKFMGSTLDAVGYTIGGRKYVGWHEFAQTMKEEFDSVDRLEIPITDLQVWQNGDVAWFAMELDYTREVVTEKGRTRTVVPLRETGVLERRNGKWTLVNWHESLQKPLLSSSSGISTGAGPSSSPLPISQNQFSIDLSGGWDIHEDDKSYRATLDDRGNGSYTWQEGKIHTAKVSDRLWSGTWSQKGNDREGAFEVLLSEDYSTAEGVWWYSRVGDQNNIPPREWGGSYIFKRITPVSPAHAGPER